MLASMAIGYATGAAEPDERPAPLPSDLEERVTRRLFQLGVALSGRPDRIADLSAEDLELSVGTRRIRDLTLDRVCAPFPDESLPRTTFPATFLFYVDQPFLDFAGRAQAFARLRELIPQLIVGENRGLVVANGKRLVTYATVTGDPDELLVAVGHAEQDLEQWDSASPFTAGKTLGQIVGGSLGSTVRVPPTFNSEDRYIRVDSLMEWSAGRQLDRLESTLGRMIEIAPPKVLVYLGDYGGFNVQALDRLIDQLLAQGIRLYKVRSAPPPKFYDSKRSIGTTYDYDLRLISEGVTRDTGGDTFEPQTSSSTLAANVLEDLGCFYLLTFDVEGLPEGRRLPVDLRVKVKKVRARVARSLLIHSESDRRIARLRGAFAAPDMVRSRVPLAGSLVLTGFDNGRYSALAQLAIESGVADAVFDLGASLIVGTGVRDDFSARMSVGRPSLVVLEQELELPIGPFELRMVAHETNAVLSSSEFISTGTLDGTLPDPKRGPPMISSTTLLQPRKATFLRGEELRASGAYAVSPSEPVLNGTPLSLSNLVCRGGAKRVELKVVARLIGEDSLPFVDLSIPVDDAPCTLAHNTIPAGAIAPGSYRYEIELWRDGQQVATESRRFDVPPTTEPTTPAARSEALRP